MLLVFIWVCCWAGCAAAHALCTATLFVPRGGSLWSARRLLRAGRATEEAQDGAGGSCQLTARLRAYFALCPALSSLLPAYLRATLFMPFDI